MVRSIFNQKLILIKLKLINLQVIKAIMKFLSIQKYQLFWIKKKYNNKKTENHFFKDAPRCVAKVLHLI